MAVPVMLMGRDSSGGAPAQVAVRPNGDLAVGPGADSLIKVVTLDTDDAAVEAIAPQAGKVIIVTASIVTTNRDVGVNGATIDVYYATTASSTDTANLLLQLVDFAKNSALAVAGDRIRVPEGNFVIAKTNDNNATVTLGYHYEAA